MRKLISKLFPARPIVLTGELLAPKPGQVLVLTTDERLTSEQARAARVALVATIGTANRVFVIAGAGRLVIREGNERCEYTEGADNER